jgi:hypothetical protein
MEDPCFRVIDFGRGIAVKCSAYELEEKMLSRSALLLCEDDV